MRSVSLLLFSIFLLPAGLTLAQSGKIAGTVIDAQTGEPLPGVNVVIEGTTTGATTDVDGFYDILNVRPGTYSVRASFIGYTAQVRENVRVNIDLTTEVDFQLQEETVGLDEIIVAAEAPIIQRDISGSERNISSEEIQAGRYQSINNVVTAQVGVNATSAYNDRPGIRGSNIEESLFIVDGVSQGDPMTNRPHYRVNLDAIQEVKLQTGGFSAEYGNLRSGVVNVVTREGGERYSGSVRFAYSPPGLKHFGPMMYGFGSPLVDPFVKEEAGAFTGNEIFTEGWNGWANTTLQPGDPHYGEPMELYARWLWRHRSQDAIDELQRLQREGLVDIEWAQGVDPDDQVFHQYGVLPDYNASVTFGGPVPLLNALKFFVTYDSDQVEYSFAYPERAYREHNVRGKLTTNLTRGTKLMMHGFYSTQKGGDGGQGPFIDGWISNNPFNAGDTATNKFWYPHCAVPGEQIRQIYGARVTHTLSANTFFEVDLSHHRTDYKMLNEIRNSAPLTGPGLEGQTSLIEGRIGTTAEAEALAAAGERGWENWRDWARIRIGDYWYDEAPRGYSPIWWVDETGEYRMSSCNIRFNDSFSRAWDFNASMTSQVTRYNQVKGGLQLRFNDIYMYYAAIDPSVNGGSINQSDVNPWNGGAYLTNKLEFRGFVANVGLRADWIVHGEFPVLDGDLGEPNSPYSEFLLPGNTRNEEGGYSIEDKIPMRRVSHFRLSPRLGISHPISTVAKIFFNYGHMYQWPEAFWSYRIQYNTRQGGRVSDIGNPLLRPPRTIAYEIGYEHNLFDRMNLRLTGYYKDINDEYDDAEFVPLGQRDYETQINKEYRDIRGLETFLELRRGTIPYFSGWASVNYLVESGGEFGFDEFFEDPTRQPSEVSTQVSDPDVRPIIKFNLDFFTPDDFGPGTENFSLLGGLNINLLYTWKRGRQFTWNPAGLPLVENNLRWVPYQRWDLRLSKELFTVGTVSSVFYIDVTNLFNQRHLTPAPDNEFEVSNRRGWAWDSHKWWNNQFNNYMNSLGFSSDKQRADGSFETNRSPGEFGDDVDMPEFTPYRFLERRDIYFGIRLYF